MELLGKSKDELRAICVAMGEPGYRGGQIYHALYAERKLDIASMTTLPAALREHLAKKTTITLPVVKQRFASTDGSVRYLFSLGGEEKESLHREHRGHRGHGEETTAAGCIRRGGVYA